ncbi:hypothetical protein KSS87_017053, partial [Heliosperma pusillum]
DGTLQETQLLYFHHLVLFFFLIINLIHPPLSITSFSQHSVPLPGTTKPSCVTQIQLLDRRQLISAFLTLTAGPSLVSPHIAAASEFADMPALRGKDYGKTKMRYPDYTQTQSGLQYKDLRMGNGPIPNTGDTVVVDWAGYTIGYYGRIFEARNKTKGGSFEGDDKDFFQFRIGSDEVIPAFKEAVIGMSLGGIRRKCSGSGGGVLLGSLIYNNNITLVPQ